MAKSLIWNKKFLEIYAENLEIYAETLQETSQIYRLLNKKSRFLLFRFSNLWRIGRMGVPLGTRDYIQAE